MADDLTRNEDLIILDGTTFFFSEPSGDVQATHADGYFFDDVRHLSVWRRLLVDGEPLLGITSSPVEYYSARVFLAPEPADAGFSVRRDRFVSEGVHEDIVVSNLEHRERRLTLELRFEADFPDSLEARDGDATASPTRHRSSFGRSSKPQRASAIGCRRSSPDSPATRRTSPSAIRPLSFRRRGPRRGRSSPCGRSSVSTWPTASCEPSPSAAA
jgi:N-terminal domain of (some) glycogen debranching enzymes